MRVLWLADDIYSKYYNWLKTHRTLYERAPRTSECPYGNRAYHYTVSDVEHLLYNDYDGEKVIYKKLKIT